MRRGAVSLQENWRFCPPQPRALTVYLRSLVEPGTEFADRMVVGPHVHVSAAANDGMLVEASLGAAGAEQHCGTGPEC